MKVFITATDTDAGKTYVSCQLLKAANQLGLSTIGSKPIASGCQLVNQQLISDDARRLQNASTNAIDLSQTNPLRFLAPIAPAIAAKAENQTLDQLLLANAFQPALQQQVDFHLIEGIGGWLQPLNDGTTLADWVIKENIPVILVVGCRLGCINHALLTAHALSSMGARWLGWIANRLEPPMQALDDNVALLRTLLTAPMLADVGYSGGIDAETMAKIMRQLQCMALQGDSVAHPLMKTP